MTSIDERIVSMKFDNASFELKLADTIKSLDRLRASIDFATSTRGLDNLTASSKKFNMQEMGHAVDGISKKFLSLATIGITTLATITSHAVQSAGRILGAFSTAPVFEGFREYETQLNSVQTILANTQAAGVNLDQVNAALQKLNEYSDLTIYNFGQMARNIGTFTAAGVDLDTSVNAIKGIANLAALSGSSSEQASSAMYQLSQAIATGTVRLIDWNSVTNAGIGGEVFKNALFETGKALGALKNVPMGQTFAEWEEKNGSFRESLEKDWLSAEVLTTTLATFTGDLDDAQLAAQGFSQAQITAIQQVAKTAVSAATEVKTFTQLMGTVKEAVGTGWADSFKIVIGNFTEAKELWTNVNNSIGEFVKNSADARNNLLQGWKDLGGRDLLIQGFKNALEAIGKIITPISKAFREIFPPMTVQRLVDLTKAFVNFTEKIKIGVVTSLRIKKIFTGVFGVVEIGLEIFKGIIRVIGDVISALNPAGSGLLEFGADTGDMLTKLNEALVAGGGIQRFFERLSGYILAPIRFINEFREKISTMFDDFRGSEAVENSLDRISSRLEMLKDSPALISNAWDNFKEHFEKVFDRVEQVIDSIGNWFSELGKKISESIKPGDFDSAVDAINVGLLGAIAVMLTKFLSGGIDIDFGGNIVDKVSRTLDELTDTLEAMQQKLTADTLMKIATAVGVLAGAILVLSLIDSNKLTSALTAISITFGQLIGVLVVISKINIGLATIRLNGLATALILLATAATILAVAVKLLSTMDISELAKGLGGVAVALGILVTAVTLLSTGTGGLVRAGISIGIIAGALLVLSLAVKAFSMLSWEEMAKGLVGIGVGLAVITAALKLMPPTSVLSGAGFVAVAFGLSLLAGSVKLFGLLSWSEIAKGLIAIGGALQIIAAAMRMMPLTLPITAAGLVLLGFALTTMAGAVTIMAQNDLGELAKGIGAIAVLLGVLAIAMNAMTTGVAGAAAVLIVSAAIVILAHAIEELSELSVGELAKGIGTIAIALGVLAIAATALMPAVPAMLSLGIALGALGIAFTLIGAGAFLTALALQTLAVTGVAGMRALVEMIEIGIKALPGFGRAIFSAIKLFLEDVLNAGPVLLKLIEALLEQLLDTVIKLVPKIAEALGVIIVEFLALIKKAFPEIVSTGAKLLLGLLQGISNNIHKFVSSAVDIMVAFANSLEQNLPRLVLAGANLILGFLREITRYAEKFAEAALYLLTEFLNGIADHISLVVDAAGNIIENFILALGENVNQIIDAGFKILTDLLSGIGNNINNVVDTVTTIVTSFVTNLGENYQRFIDAGFKVLTDLLQGIGDNISTIATTVGEIVTEFVTDMGKAANNFITAGADALEDFIWGLFKNIGEVARTAAMAVAEFIRGIDDNLMLIINAGADMILDFMNGIAKAIDKFAPKFREAGWNIAKSIIDGITGGLLDGAAGVVETGRGIAESVLGTVRGAIGFGSPATEFIEIGKSMIDGLVIGMSDDRTATNSATELADKVITNFQDTLSKIPQMLSDMGTFNPVITPVLDLTKVAAESKNINALMGLSRLSPEVSVSRAQYISTTSDLEKSTPDEPIQSGPTELKFEQNIFSPKALSTNDIYRNTKNQIALAKEELNI